MRREDFQIDETFWCGDRMWLCTDKGTRVVIAIELGPILVTTMVDGVQSQAIYNYQKADDDGWFSGPPYAVVENVFDENDIEGCSKQVPGWLE